MARKVDKQQELKFTELHVLKCTLELLRDPNRWTKGWFARDEFDNKCGANESVACKFCIIGAMRHVAGVSYYDITLSCLNLLYKSANTMYISNLNDSAETTHADILTLLTKTIKELENG